MTSFAMCLLAALVCPFGILADPVPVAAPVPAGQPLRVRAPNGQLPTNQIPQMTSPQNPQLTSSDQDAGDLVGSMTSDSSIGTPTAITYQCTFLSDATYTCKTDCADGPDDLTSQSFPDRPLLKYLDRNCSTNLTIDSGATWKPTHGYITKQFDMSILAQIVATCSFYQTMWYECYGVADCSRGEGITSCAGAAPWRGFYQGSAEKGTLFGNITAQAQNSAPSGASMPAAQTPVSPNPNLPVPAQLPSTPRKKVVMDCEKFVDSSAICYGFEKTCSGAPEKQTCSHSRKSIARTPASETYYSKFDAVVGTISEKSLAAAVDILLNCYFYDNGEYLCGFPFAVDFSRDEGFPLKQATGSYFRNAA